MSNQDKWSKDDFKWMFWFAVFVVVFLLLIIGPKPYWIDGGGMILR